MFAKDKDHNTCKCFFTSSQAFLPLIGRLTTTVHPDAVGLHFAAQRGHLHVLKWLVKLGAPIVEQNLYKKAALDVATHHNHRVSSPITCASWHIVFFVNSF